MGIDADNSQFHVLVVDDNLIDRTLVQRIFKSSSFQVSAVDSACKALEFLGCKEDDCNQASVSPKEVGVSLVITDYCMPEMSGYDLLKKMKACLLDSSQPLDLESSSLRSIPVAIMSSENVPSRITRCLEEGAVEFLVKPLKMTDVKKLIPHLMKTKCKNILEEVSENKEIQQSGNKRKSDEGISPGDGTSRSRTRSTPTSFTKLFLF